MVNCARCCLHNSMRCLNLFVNIFGVGVIIYTLWLLKKWQDGVTELPHPPLLPKPTYIYGCLGVGIAVCFSTFCSYLVAHYISKPALLIYIVFVVSLLCLEVAAIVSIFYKMNWPATLAEDIDENHTEFKDLMIFHLYVCRLIAILILVPQIKCIALAIVLLAIGTEPLTHCNYSNHVTDFRYSFLVLPSHASLLNMTRREALPRSDLYEYPRQSFFAHMNRFFRMQFHRRVILG